MSSMRTFVNGTLKMTGSGYPPHNTEGVPMHNFPAPHIQKPADPSRMYILGDPRSVTIRAVNEISRKFSQYLENIILSFNNIESKCLTNAERTLNIKSVSCSTEYETSTKQLTFRHSESVFSRYDEQILKGAIMVIGLMQKCRYLIF